MPPRTPRAAAALLGMAMLATACVGAGQDPTSDEGRDPGPQLQVLPAIAQPGVGPAPADAARHVATATFDATLAGRPVSLVADDGATTLGRARLDEDGTASFVLPAGSASDLGPVRATATDEDGEPVHTEPATADGWGTPVFGDEFDGSSLDPARWMYRQLGKEAAAPPRSCAAGATEAVAVSGGTVQLSVLPDPEYAGLVCQFLDDTTGEAREVGHYLNGHVATQGLFQFRYGVAAARVRFQQHQGQHGSFWIQRDVPAVGGPETSGAEIDVVEYYGSGRPDGGLSAFVHWVDAEGDEQQAGGPVTGASHPLPASDAWWQEYHVYSVEWTPEEYVFRVDDTVVYRMDEAISDVEQFLVLSLLTSNWELPRLDASQSPQTMDVDWVRVWQR